MLLAAALASASTAAADLCGCKGLCGCCRHHGIASSGVSGGLVVSRSDNAFIALAYRLDGICRGAAAELQLRHSSLLVAENCRRPWTQLTAESDCSALHSACLVGEAGLPFIQDVGSCCPRAPASCMSNSLAYSTVSALSAYA